MKFNFFALVYFTTQSFLVLNAIDFYIAPDGNDSNPGTLDKPFATLERGRQSVREINQIHTPDRGTITVWLRGGVYPLSAPFKLSEQDSGCPGAPVVYRAFKNEKPVLTGGQALTGFVPCHQKILQADLAAQKLKGIYFRQLFFDGHSQPLARYPNFDPKNPIAGGWAYADGKLRPMYQDIPGEDKHTLLYKDTDERHWHHPEDAEVFIYPRYNWRNDIVRIKSVDESTRTLTLASDCSYAIRPNDRYYVQNLLEELDSPGEWYLDKRTSILYFWPPAPLDKQKIVVPVTKTLLQLEPGAAHITVRGLTLECCSSTAIILNNTVDCMIVGNTLHNIGDDSGSAISVKDGKNNGIVGNDIYQIGRNGIQINGGNRITLTPSDNYADNNCIHDVGLYFKAGTGIGLSGCGNRASHNLIYNCPRSGITFSGNNLVIEYNHIYSVCLETEDTGAVYTSGRDWIGSRGCVLRNNYIHDISGFGQHNGRWIFSYFAWGIYLDDNTGGVNVIGNIVARCSQACLNLHNARDNLINNNIFLDGGEQQVEFRGWTTTSKPWQQYFTKMVEGYQSVINQPAWKEMRNIKISPSESVLQNGMTMLGNQVVCNIFYYQNPHANLYKFHEVPFDHNFFDYNLIFHQDQPLNILQEPTSAAQASDPWGYWQSLREDQHSLCLDPHFLDPSQDNYQLNSDSPAFQLGFKPIPMEKIGPYEDELRASWPLNKNPEN